MPRPASEIGLKKPADRRPGERRVTPAA